MEIASKQRSVEKLIASCEGLVSDNTQFKGKDWKLSQYVTALRKQVTELNKYSSFDRDKMAMYQQKLTVLEGIVSSPTTTTTTQECDGTERSNGGSSKEVIRSSLTRRLEKEKAERAELFGESTGLRQRTGSGKMSDSGSEVVIERQRRHQEAIAEEMMGLARNLKENAMAAKDIILKDNQVLKETSKKADKNITDVDTQTGRIKQHSRGCPWGTLLLLISVFLIFICMVILIRFVPKPR